MASLDERREAAAQLRELGWSTRRIARALGISHVVVQQDLQLVGGTPPAGRVQGLDGRSYPARAAPGSRAGRRARPRGPATAPRGPSDARTGVRGPLPSPQPPAARTGPENAPAGPGPWPRVRQPSLGDGAAVRARAALDPDRAAPPDQPLDRGGPPACPACGRQHPVPGPRGTVVEALLAPARQVDPRIRGAAPPGWGRNRGRGS
jgi:hypothetical protein